MPLDPDRSPPDPEENAEAYMLGKLNAEDATAFENHYITYAACVRTVATVDEYVRAMRRIDTTPNTIRNTRG